MTIGSQLLCYDTLSSTNTTALQMISDEEPPEGTVVYAGYQTSGKGCGENSWESERNKNLTFSIILYPQSVLAEKQFIISESLSLGIRDFVIRHLPSCSIKWPNDIYIEDKKIAGILIENSILGSSIKSSVAGIGLKVNQTDFPAGIPDPASMKLLTGIDFDLNVILQELLADLDKRYRQLLYGDREIIKQEYVSVLYRYKEWHNYKSSECTFKGRITGISDQGQLIMEDQKGSIVKYSFKDIDYLP